MKTRVEFLKDNINEKVYDFIYDLRNYKHLTLNEICIKTAEEFPLLKLKTNKEVLFYEALALMLAVIDKFDNKILGKESK